MSPHKLDQLDRDILNAIQKDFPVESRPWAVLAQRLGPGGQHTEEEILDRVKNLRRDGFIRRLGAVFNAASLGYHSTLCAAEVPQENLDKFVALVNAATEVTHNYLRCGRLNIWFTFTTNRPEDLAVFLAKLKKEGGATEINEFKSERRFKINLDFHL